MTRVVLSSLQVGAGASKGHLHPVLGVAERLVELGHDVAWTSVPHALPDEDRRQVARTGARVVDCASPGPGRSAAALSRTALDPARAWEVYRGFLVDPIATLVPRLAELLGREQPDVIAADGLAYAMHVAARRARLPCATLCAGLKLAGPADLATGYRFDLSALAEPRRAAFARHGVEGRFHMLECRSDLDVMFATRELVGDVPGLLLAGPSRTRGPRGDEPAFPWHRLRSGHPLVVMAFGSVHTHELLPDIVEPFARAARARGADVVIASEAHARLGAADGAILVPYAPQRALLERAAVFVTHGGAGSVIESLAAGVPPIVVPLSGDQTLQAQLVAARDAGIWLERAAIDEPSAARAVDRVLAASCPLVAGARRIRDAWHGLDGALVAARAIVELAC